MAEPGLAESVDKAATTAPSVELSHNSPATAAVSATVTKLSAAHQTDSSTAVDKSVEDDANKVLHRRCLFMNLTGFTAIVHCHSIILIICNVHHEP